MKFEHCAINVEDSVSVAKWYVENCGLSIALALDEDPYTHFLADEGGRVFLEIYARKDAPVPDYANMHHLQYHLAFASTDAAKERDRLLGAGCSLVEELNPASGTTLVMLRDPFGIPLQICQRAKPF